MFKALSFVILIGLLLQGCSTRSNAPLFDREACFAVANSRYQGTSLDEIVRFSDGIQTVPDGDARRLSGTDGQLMRGYVGAIDNCWAQDVAQFDRVSRNNEQVRLRQLYRLENRMRGDALATGAITVGEYYRRARSMATVRAGLFDPQQAARGNAVLAEEIASYPGGEVSLASVRAPVTGDDVLRAGGFLVDMAILADILTGL